MDTYIIQRAIMASELTPTEKLVGMVLAVHYNRSRFSMRVSRALLVQETGLSATSIKRTLHTLREAGFFIPRRTGRSSIFAVGKIVEEWKGSQRPHQTGSQRTHRKPEDSTDCFGEDLYKRELERGEYGTDI